MDTQAATVVSGHYIEQQNHPPAANFSTAAKPDNPTSIVVSPNKAQTGINPNKDDNDAEIPQHIPLEKHPSSIFRSRYRRETSYDDQIREHILMAIREATGEVVWQVPSLDKLQMRAYLQNLNYFNSFSYSRIA